MKNKKFTTCLVVIGLFALFTAANAERLTASSATAKKIESQAQKMSIKATEFTFQEGAATEEYFAGSRQGGEDIATATVIPSLPYLDSGTTAGYNDDYDEKCPTASTSPDVVYAYTPPTVQRIHILTCADQVTAPYYWSKVFVYENDTTGGAIACNQFSDSCSNPYHGAIFDLTVYQDSTYYIVIDGFSGQSGDYVLYMEARPPVDTTSLHPALGDNGSGLLALAYEYNEYDSSLYWQSSTDDGGSWSDVVYWAFSGGVARYASLDYWGNDTSFYGTLVPPSVWYSGAPNYLVTMANATDIYGTSGSYWPWNDYGWYDMKMIDISCDANRLDWEWGFQSMVHSTSSTTYGPFVDAPHIFYPTDAEGYATISWLTDIEGCSTTTCDIDRKTARAYAMYDWLDPETSIWTLLGRQERADAWDDTLFAGGYSYIMDDSSHTAFPAVAASNGNLVIVTENWDNITPDDKDLICWYTSDGDLANLTTSTVIGTEDAERYPEIQHISGSSFLCTFIENNGLYATLTEDGGVTWGEPVLVSQAEDLVVNEYRAADIAESNGYFVKIIYEYKESAKLEGNTYLRIIDHMIYEPPDTDLDGVYDYEDNCPLTSNPGQEDDDYDDVGNVCDNCPNVANPDQTDTDDDTHGDACDNCPNTINHDQSDVDTDTVGDVCDNCPDTPNTDQANSDTDTYGDACDNCPNDDNQDQSDVDSDTVGDVCDNCLNTPNTDQANSDTDTHGDACDNCPNDDNQDQLNSDTDSHGDVCDNCPLVDNEDQLDSNGNGVGDACDWICGDVNGSGGINLLDINFLLNYIYKEGPAPDPLESADVNNSGGINLLDINYLINYIYKEGPEPNCP